MCVCVKTLFSSLSPICIVALRLIVVNKWLSGEKSRNKHRERVTKGEKKRRVTNREKRTIVTNREKRRVTKRKKKTVPETERNSVREG